MVNQDCSVKTYILVKILKENFKILPQLSPHPGKAVYLECSGVGDTGQGSWAG